MSSDRSDPTDRTTPFDTPSRSSFDPASRDSRHSGASPPNTSPGSRRSADGSSSDPSPSEASPDSRHSADRRRPRHAPGVRPSGDRRPPATRQTRRDRARRRKQTGNDPRSPRERRPWLHADDETDPTRPDVTAERLRWLVRTATVVALLAGGLAVLTGLLAAVGTPLATTGDAPLGSTAEDALLDSTTGDSLGLVGTVTVGGTLLAVITAVIAVGGVVLLAVHRPR